MQTRRCRTATERALLFVTLAMALASMPALAQVNSWTNPVSGNWDQVTNWSAGALPNSSQSVRITNSGWKAVAINPSTPINFPGSMIVSNLTIGGPTNTVNTLLLNFFGTTTPLHVVDDFNIEPNGHLLMFYSGLTVDQMLNVNGPFDQEGGQLLFTNSPTNTMQIEGGHFNLTNGVVTGKNMYLGGATDGFVTQASGVVSLDWLLLGIKSFSFDGGGGTYTLQGGWLMVNVFEGLGEHGLGTLIQSGGTNSASTLFVGPGNYFKNGGGLFAGEVAIVTSGSSLTHAGGTTTITNVLRMDASGPGGARFNMLGGTLSTTRIEMESAGLVTQSNGTVNVTGELFMEENGSGASVNTYYLNGGNLFAAKTTVSFSSHSSTSFIQTGGAHIVTNTLWINGTSTIYQFRGGTINAPNIVLTGNISQPPQFFVLGAAPYAITNQTVTLTGGAIVIQDSAQQFGSLTLTLDSGINLAGNSAILRFADSHTNDWRGGLTWRIPPLLVYNWNGSTNGGGSDQLVFGNNSSALTASQLAQIQFVNPAGFPSGNYPARILSTGEVVPTTAPTLGFQNNGASLVLNWPGNFILQSATNVLGPYVDVPEATSPYTVNVSQFPMQFFRLRN
jgi:hypothetical protein